MSFAFGFSDNDLNENEISNNIGTTSEKIQTIFQNPLDESKFSDTNKPSLHNFETVVQSLKGIRFTFRNHFTAKQNVVYRRELYDVKHQLMLEENLDSDSSDSANDEIFKILLGDSNEDVKKNVYEGGLKSWECSYDAVDYLSDSITEKGENFWLQHKKILEFGCGTSLPSCFLFQKIFTSKTSETPIELILSDFNYSVLRLVSLPNLIINWASTLDPKKLYELTCANDEPFNNDEVLLSEALIDELLRQIQEKNVKLSFLSGSWSHEFINLVGKQSVDLLISSETIYDPFNLKIVGESIIELLASDGKDGHCGLAIVIAKDFYFGVGGSVSEFLGYLNRRKDMGIPINVNVKKVESSLKRSIVEIYKK